MIKPQYNYGRSLMAFSTENLTEMAGNLIIFIAWSRETNAVIVVRVRPEILMTTAALDKRTAYQIVNTEKIRNI